MKEKQFPIAKVVLPMPFAYFTLFQPLLCLALLLMTQTLNIAQSVTNKPIANVPMKSSLSGVTSTNALTNQTFRNASTSLISSNYLSAASSAITVASTNATPATLSVDTFSTMETLDNVYKLSLGDRCSFRIVEDQIDPNEPIEPRSLIVTDSGDVELPYIGRFPALGKTCRGLAKEIKKELEKEYYYQATVIVAVNTLTKSVGKVYLVGQLRTTGSVDIPGDEVFTISKAILRTGGFSEYADKRNVKLTRKADPAGNKTQTFIINVSDIIEKGKTQNDMKLEAGDLIFVPSRLINF